MSSNDSIILFNNMSLRVVFILLYLTTYKSKKIRIFQFQCVKHYEKNPDSCYMLIIKTKHLFNAKTLKCEKN